MRILLTIHHVLDVNAGAASVVLRLAREYRELGHEVEVLSFDDLPARLPKALGALAFPIYLASRRAHAATFDVVDASSGDAWLLHDALRRSPDRPLLVTHSHGLEQLAAQVEQEAARRAGGSIPLGKRLYRYGYRLHEVARSFQAADLALVLNDDETEFLAARAGVSRSAIARARLGVGLPALADASPVPPAGDDGQELITQIGSYIERKGVQVTAAAMTQVMHRRPNVRLKFLGALKEAEVVLRDYPADLHPRIAVVPRYDNGDIPRLISGAAANLMPSLFEGYGIAKIEAMACGVVPVVSDDGGARADVEDGVNGLVTPRGDAEALAIAVERLLSDPPLRTRLREAGLATARALTWRAVAAERLELYRRHRRRPAAAS